MLELRGYDTQVMEFIDMEHTPKNILIRAVKKSCHPDSKNCHPELVSGSPADALTKALKIAPTLKSLLN